MMDTLLTTLTRLDEYFASRRPIFAENLLPGLSVQEIDEVVADLPFRLSEEFYVLYQWHNGVDISVKDSLRFDSYVRFFSPLNICLKNYHFLMKLKWDCDFDDDEINPKWFPIISNNGESYFFTKGATDQTSSSELIYLWASEDWSFEPNYESIESFVKSIYECYIAGVYDIDDNEEVICTNEKLEEEIHRKYNPNQPSWELKFE
jgi:hypothetical protein